MQGIRGLISDLDGVYYHAQQAIPGAAEALAEIRRRGYPIRFLTNITRRSRATVAQNMRDLGMDIADEEVLTASYLTARYLRRLSGRPRCWIVLDGDGRDEFEGLNLGEEKPDYVVIGNRTKSFSYDLLNRILAALWEGAHFLAMQADPYDLGQGRPQVNVGAWIALLERASGRKALLIGKPSCLAFQIALEELGLPPSQVAHIGDRVEADVVGAWGAGLRTILVRTGHFRPQDLASSPVRPDLVLDSFADLPRFLDR